VRTTRDNGRVDALAAVGGEALGGEDRDLHTFPYSRWQLARASEWWSARRAPVENGPAFGRSV
jgi:hypothetical protein